MVEWSTPMSSHISCAEARALLGSVALMCADATVRPRVNDQTWRQWRSVTPATWIQTAVQRGDTGGSRINKEARILRASKWIQHSSPFGKFAFFPTLTTDRSTGPHAKSLPIPLVVGLKKMCVFCFSPLPFLGRFSLPRVFVPANAAGAGARRYAHSSGEQAPHEHFRRQKNRKPLTITSPWTIHS